MKIEFAGRVVRIDSDQGTFYVAPDEMFEIVDWANSHTLALFIKSREMVHMEERNQMKERPQQTWRGQQHE